jgi:hypothetical protein
MKITKIKGSNPERFMIHSESDDPKAFRRTDVLSEEQIREAMTRLAATQIEIDTLIEKARKNEGE